MLDQGYYIAAQLPELVFGMPVFPLPEDFKAEAKKWLWLKELAVLDAIDLASCHRSLESAGQSVTVLKRYCQFEQRLRGEIAAFRQGKKDQPFELISPTELKVLNPLEREIALLQIRWSQIQELITDYYADLSYFVLYLLKLQILRRLSLFNAEAGRTVFEQLSKPPLPPASGRRQHGQ